MKLCKAVNPNQDLHLTIRPAYSHIGGIFYNKSLKQFGQPHCANNVAYDLFSLDNVVSVVFSAGI